VFTRRLGPGRLFERAVILLSADSQSLSFAEDIKPLFRSGDREAMEPMFDLWSHEDVSGHSDPILERLQEGSMPCDGAWPEEKVEMFRRWIESGKQP
jgi:hypothetical protein